MSRLEVRHCAIEHFGAMLDVALDGTKHPSARVVGTHLAAAASLCTGLDVAKKDYLKLAARAYDAANRRPSSVARSRSGL